MRNEPRNPSNRHLKMRVIIGCEVSGVIRRAFRARGHDAWSCDLKAAPDGSSHHIQGDIFALSGKFDIAGKHWDLGIFHPPCTRLCLSGVLRLYKLGKKVNGIDPEKWREMEVAALFFRQLWGLSIPKLCLENPVPHGHAGLPDYHQIIQPYYFGEDASKKTCLWLRGLPLLTAGRYHPPRMVCRCGAVYKWEQEFKGGCPACGPGLAQPRWSNQTDSGQNKLPPSDERAALRAVTYPGIAEAMAKQWTTR